MQVFMKLPRKTNLSFRKRGKRGERERQERKERNRVFKQGLKPGKDQQAMFENRLLYP